MATQQEEADFAAMTAHFAPHPFEERPEKEVRGEFSLDSSHQHAMTGTHFEAADVKISGNHFLVGCTFNGGTLAPSAINGKMLRCTFRKVRFKGAVSTNFEDCRFKGCTFDHDVYLAPELRIVRCRGLETSFGLDLVQADARYPSLQRDLADLPLAWWCRWRSTWADLRGVGSLPFFGLSYAGVPLLLMLIAAIDLYNLQATAWSTVLEHDAGPVGSLMRDFRRIAIPAETVLLLMSGIALMIASTIYATCCPSRIKEFSLHRWVEEFGKQSINYLPLSWQAPGWRWSALILYTVGGGLAFVVLCMRLWVAWGQLSRNIG